MGGRSGVIGATGYRREFLAIPPPTRNGEGAVLLCDPLTGLIGYPSFQECLTAELPALAPVGLHLAIGDVDDLKRFVTERRADDPTMFGHLAGNDCMQRLGAATLEWSETELGDWEFALCGTFGGDEVVVAACGGPYEEFVRTIADLADRVKRAAPRSCSFAVGTARATIRAEDAPHAYRNLVASVDAALFERKEAMRRAGIDPAGELVDVATIELERPPAVGR